MNALQCYELLALRAHAAFSAGCGNEIANGGTNVTESDCNFACTGDASEICGAGSESGRLLRFARYLTKVLTDRLSVYWDGVAPPPPPITVPSVGQWESLGCFT